MFAKAREKARQSSCQSNVKQMSLGVLQYAQDYDERLPSADCAGLGSGQNWHIVIEPYMKNDQTMVCPSESAPLTITAGGATCSSPNPPVAAFVRTHRLTYAYTLGQRLVALGTLQAPAEIWMLCDASYPWAYAGPDSVAGYATYIPNSRYRHNDGLNATFMDGHAKWMSMQNWKGGKGVKNVDADSG